MKTSCIGYSKHVKIQSLQTKICRRRGDLEVFLRRTETYVCSFEWSDEYINFLFDLDGLSYAPLESRNFAWHHHQSLDTYTMIFDILAIQFDDFCGGN